MSSDSRIKSKFAAGDWAYLNDTMTRTSKSVFRVDILAVDTTGGVVRYLIRPSKRPNLTPWLVAERVLTDTPCAAKLSPSQQARWVHMRDKKRSAK